MASTVIQTRLYECGFHLPLVSSIMSCSVRLIILTSCLYAVKTFIDAFLSLSGNSYGGFTKIDGEQIVTTLMAPTRLSLFEAPDWDLEQARQVAHLPA